MDKPTSGTVPTILKLQYYKTFIKNITVKARFIAQANADRVLINSLKTQVNLLSFKFKAVFESSHNYYVFLDPDMNILDFNRRANQLIKQFFGKRMTAYEPILKYLHPDSAAIIMANCKRALSGETFEIERRMDCPAKISTWWSFQYLPAYDLKGKIAGVIFNARDITQRKAYEKKLELQYQKLREISLMNSHDVRGPVCSIMGIMTIIKEGDYQPDRQCLQFIETAAELLDKNTRKLAKYTHDIEQGIE